MVTCTKRVLIQGNGNKDGSLCTRIFYSIMRMMLVQNRLGWPCLRAATVRESLHPFQQKEGIGKSRYNIFVLLLFANL